MFKRNVPQPRQDAPPKGKLSIEVHVEDITGEYEKQLARIKYAQTRMRECEDNAILYYNKFLQRKAEIEIQVEQEYTGGVRSTLGSTKSHLLDERIGKDSAAGSAASNNKWYISQATMYAEIVQAEIAMMQRTHYRNKGSHEHNPTSVPSPRAGA